MKEYNKSLIRILEIFIAKVYVERKAIIKKHFDIARDFRQWKNPDHKKVYVVNK